VNGKLEQTGHTSSTAVDPFHTWCQSRSLHYRRPASEASSA